MNLRSFSCLPVLAGLGLCACAASPQVRVDQAHVDLTQCRSFGWYSESTGTASLTEQRVRAEVLRQLEAKGYPHTSETPDCRIAYELTANERPEAKPRVGVGVGGGSRGVGGGIGVSLPVGKRSSYVGQFALSVIDAVRRAQIWRGSIEASFAQRELTPQEAADVVRTVLAKYPDASASAQGN